jgi:transposase
MKPIVMDGGASPKETRRRRFWSADEKRRMIAESVAPGASVSKVAQRYGVNANLLFTWRRQAGVSQTPVEAIAFLPVKVADESARAPTSPPGPTPPAAAGRMEIALVGGERIVVGADVDAAALARVLNVLSRR